MPRIPFNGDFYTSKSKLANAQRTINWYTETDPTGKNKTIAYPTPGLVLKVTVGTGPIRGMINFNDLLYVVSGNEFYEVSVSFGKTLIGTLTTSSGPVSMAHNGSLAPGQEIIIVDGSTTTWIYDAGASTFTAVADTDAPTNATQVVFFDGLFLANDPTGVQTGQSGAFMWSNSYSGTAWEALDFATAERNPDDLIALATVNKTIYLFGKTTTELWYNASGTDAVNPFKPQTSIGIGVIAAETVVRTGDSLIWLSTSDDRGMSRVTIATGTQTKPISTYALENEWDKYSTISDARAFMYEQDGHTFYEITFPTGDRTFVYDLLEDKWHERETYNAGAGGKHKVTQSTHYAGFVLVGDDTGGQIYSYDTAAYTDNGAQIVRQRDTQHMAMDTNISLRHTRVTLEFENGVGSTVTSGTDDGSHATTKLLEDSAATFTTGITAGTHIVYNSTDNTESAIASIDSATQITLVDDIMASGNAYIIGIDPQIELYWSDDRGATWKGPLYRNLGLPGDNVKKVVVPNLGSSKDRIYRIKGSDDANYTMVGGFLDIMDSPRES